MEAWLNQLWDNLTAVSVPVLILGLGLQTTQTLLVALAWRNILRSAYPDGGVKYSSTLAYYAGGTGLNSILPASAGTVAMIGLFRTNIRGATVAGLVGATLVQNIFFAVIAVVVYGWLFLGVAGSLDVTFNGLSGHGVAVAVILIGGGALIALVVRILWRRLKQTWEKAVEGGAILSTPRVYMTQVAGVEALSYAARMGVNATFMYAFHIPVSVQNIFLIVAASSISSTIALAPGAVGAQTGLAQVVLSGVASPAAISAYSVGQAVITTAWSCLFGLTLLAREIGWRETRRLLHTHKDKDRDDELDGEDPAQPIDQQPVT
jgi:uncharacterized membrane protein YbhN (UPF0104 family)